MKRLLLAAPCRLSWRSPSASPPSAQILPSYGEDRAGTSGFQFLKVAVDPRGAALGGTAVATATDASSLFWNPALAARAGDTELQAAHLNYLADVSMSYVAGLRRVGPVTLGAHVQTLDSGDMQVTDEFSGPAGTGETFGYLGVAAGLTVSQALTDLFSYGVTAKLRPRVLGRRRPDGRPARPRRGLLRRRDRRRDRRFDPQLRSQRLGRRRAPRPTPTTAARRP